MIEIVKNPEVVAACLTELSDTILSLQDAGVAQGRFAREKPEWNWIITRGNKKDYLASLDVQLEGYPYSAYIKADGCCEIKRIHNKDTKTEMEDFIHICDIPQFIKILQSLEDFRMNNINGAE